MTRTPAPIVLFVYNRPDHTTRTLEALASYGSRSEANLYIYSDGPKKPEAVPQIQQVRKVIQNAHGLGFCSVSIVERDKNWGLARSVIAGVGEVLVRHGKAIILEDDIVATPDFFEFANEGLDRYRDDPKVFSIAGSSPVREFPASYCYDAYGGYRAWSWGWATWLDRWQKVDWEMRGYERFNRDSSAKRLFNRGGDDLTLMLQAQMAGKIDSWAVRWAYAHYAHEAYCIYPRISKIQNIGLDGSGTHSTARDGKDCRWLERTAEGRIEGQAGYRFPEDPRPVPQIAKAFARAYDLPLRSKIIVWLKREVIERLKREP